jgi:hypothetical protein
MNAGQRLSKALPAGVLWLPANTSVLTHDPDDFREADVARPFSPKPVAAFHAGIDGQGSVGTLATLAGNYFPGVFGIFPERFARR